MKVQRLQEGISLTVKSSLFSCGENLNALAPCPRRHEVSNLNELLIAANVNRLDTPNAISIVQLLILQNFS